MTECADCGARHDDGRTCEERFNELLALDHSRQEPWGSRHGLAFGVFALQHPGTYSPASVKQALELLRRVYRDGEDRARVTGVFRARMARSGAARDGHSVTAPMPHRPFAMTIVDMGEFEADEYAAKLESWCLATLDAYDASGAG